MKSPAKKSAQLSIDGALAAHNTAAADLQGGIAAIREGIARVADETAELRRAAPDDAELERNIEKFVSSMAAEAHERLNFDVLAESDIDVVRAAEALGHAPRKDAGPLPVSALLFAAAMNPASLKQQLFATARAAIQRQGRIQLPAAEVIARRQALLVEHLRLSAAEEKAIRAAENRGISIRRRTDADPSIVITTDTALDVLAAAKAVHQ